MIWTCNKLPQVTRLPDGFQLVDLVPPSEEKLAFHLKVSFPLMKDVTQSTIQGLTGVRLSEEIVDEACKRRDIRAAILDSRLAVIGEKLPGAYEPDSPRVGSCVTVSCARDAFPKYGAAADLNFEPYGCEDYAGQKKQPLFEVCSLLIERSLQPMVFAPKVDSNQSLEELTMLCKQRSELVSYTMEEDEDKDEVGSVCGKRTLPSGAERGGVRVDRHLEEESKGNRKGDADLASVEHRMGRHCPRSPSRSRPYG